MRRILFTIAMTLVITVLIIWYIAIPVMFPLNHLLRTTSIRRVEIENRPLKEVVREVVAQLEIKSGKKMSIIFAPEGLAEKIREKSGGVFSNRPIEGMADNVLDSIAMEYCCNIDWDSDDVIIFYN